MTFSILKEWLKHYQHILFYIVLGIVTFVLSNHFSKDWLFYTQVFEVRIANVPWADIFANLSIFKEPLYILTSKAVGEVIGYSCLIFLTTTSLLTLKLNYIKKITNSCYLGTFFYACFYLLSLEGTAIRAAFSVAFVIAAFFYLKEQKFLTTFLLIILASQLHFSALVFLIVFPLYFFKSINTFINIAFVFSPLLIIFDVSILNIVENVAGILNPRYLDYFNQEKLVSQNSTGLFFYFIVFTFMLLGVVVYYLRGCINTSRFTAVMISVSLCGVIAMCVLHDYVAFATRLGELLLLPSVILLTKLLNYFQLEKKRVHSFGLVIVSFMYFLAKALYLYSSLLKSYSFS